MKTKISAPASCGPTREIALLMADPSPARWGQPGRCGCVADRSLHEERQVIKGDVERAVDQERRDVRHREVARTKERQRNQRVRNPRHVEGQGDRAEYADGERNIA